MSGRIVLEGDAAESSGLDWIPRVVEVDLVDSPGPQRPRKVDEHRPGIALILQLGRAHHNLVDVKRSRQIKLYARAIFDHPEADGILPADKFLLRAHPDIEMLRKHAVLG